MGSIHSLESDVAYLKNLVCAGLDGIASTRQEWDGGVFTSATKAAVWAPAAIGAALGILSTRQIRNRRSASRMARSGLVGGALAFGAAVAWASRRFTGTAVRSGLRNVNVLRDARWLERHPINYA